MPLTTCTKCGVKFEAASEQEASAIHRPCPRCKMIQEDRLALKYAGLMGHTIAICATSGKYRRLLAQCDDLAWARQKAKDFGAAADPIIYRRKGKKWEPIGE